MPTSLIWTGVHSFVVGNRLGMFSLYDTRYNFNKQNSVSIYDTKLESVDVSSFCQESHMLAFGGSNSKIALFDIRSNSKSLHTFSTSYSIKCFF